MVRRSSARIRERNGTTPTRDISSDHVISRLTEQTPTKLTTLAEDEEDIAMPGSFPVSTSPLADFNVRAVTPVKQTPIKPSDAEMHPQRHYQSTAKPRDEARHLGFSNMVPQTEPPRQSQGLFALQETPTRPKDSKSNTNLSCHPFSFRRANSLELSPLAKSLLHEKREEAARVREQMIANGDMKHLSDGSIRKMAVPRSLSGRFGQAHTQAFEKMDSIAGHASAFRADPNRNKHISSMQTTYPSTAVKELKRKQSRAELDSPVQYPTLPSVGVLLQPATSAISTHVPTSGVSGFKRTTPEFSSSAKRVKVTATDDASSNKKSDSDRAGPIYSTPRRIPASARQNRLLPPSSTSRLASTGAHAIGAQKSRLPGLTPIKSHMSRPPAADPVDSKATAPLLARSPAKPPVIGKSEVVFGSPSRMTSTLFSRSPTKFGFGDKSIKPAERNDITRTSAQPFLSQSPTRALTGSIFGPVAARAPEDKPASLFSKSAIKAPFVKTSATIENESLSNPSTVPLLLRSPSKHVPLDSVESATAKTADTINGANLMDRLQLLRKSPVKSILRSPQRLYSDDPSKVAAGTHLATPPRFNASKSASAKSRTVSTPLATQKRVDFTSSTKAREKDASKTPEPEMNAAPSPSTSRISNAPASPSRPEMPYPDLALSLSPSPQKRRQTATPRDFTFQAGDAIIFGPSRQASASPQRAATIRHVSSSMPLVISLPAPPLTGSKKRKLDFESNFPAGTAASDDVNNTSDKENNLAASRSDSATEEDRPSKRMKPSAPTPSPARAQPTSTNTASAKKPLPTARRPTLGVKPKKGTPAAEAAKKKALTSTSKSTLNSTAKSQANVSKSSGSKPNTISRDRLNTLSQPKART